MKKRNFAYLLLGVVGGLLFALGMCMCLLPEWNAFTPGVILGCAGAVVLLATLLVRLKVEGQPIFHKVSGRVMGAVLLGIVGVLVFGTGMCMVMVWEMLIPGILVGLGGIILLLFLIPLVMGLK